MVVFAILAAALLVTAVHESGHLACARLAGATVLAVRVGYGPRIGAFRAAGTDYVIALLPLGGRVHYRRLGSEAGNAAIAVAGPAANFAFAFVLLAVVAAAAGVEAMPGGGAGGPVGYAVTAIASWVGLVGRVAAGWFGGPPAPGQAAVAELADALGARGVAPAAYFLAVLSTLWGVLNLISIPVVATDGWQVAAAGARALRRRVRRGP